MSIIATEHLNNVCGFRSEENTCAFLMISGEGFSCAKNTTAESLIRERLAAGTMNAKGDNCDGWKD